MPTRDQVKLKLQRQRYYEKNREKILEKGRAYLKAHPRKRTEYMRDWWAAHPEKRKWHSERRRFHHAAEIKEKKRAYYLKNRKRLLEKQKRYYETHKKECQRKMKANAWKYRLSHKETCRRAYWNNIDQSRKNARIYARMSYQKDPEKWLARAKANARHRKIAMREFSDPHSVIADFMHSIRAMAFVACTYCGQIIPGRFVHFDHYIPLNRNGRHQVDNLKPACPTCNLSKKDTHPDIWLAHRKN